VFTLSHKLSAMSFGQDRYRRRYWVLPKCGGILVEGLESGEPESAEPNAPETYKQIDESVDKNHCFKPVTSPDVEESCGKVEQIERNCMRTDANSSADCKVKTEDLTVEPSLGNDKLSQGLLVCDKMDIKSNESSAVKQERESAVSNSCSLLKSDLISLNCLITDDIKLNGEVGVIDCKNGFVDLKNCIRSDVKVEPLPASSPAATAADTKQGNLADYSCMDIQDQMAAADSQLISVAADPSESATNDSLQSSLCCKADDVQPPRTPGTDDITLLQHSSMLQLAVSNARLMQFNATSSHSYSIASSQRTSQVATPSSEVGTGAQLDASTASTPVSFVQQSQTSTPGLLSTSLTDDFQLSADGELQPDYLAIPQNVQQIALGIFCNL